MARRIVRSLRPSRAAASRALRLSGAGSCPLSGVRFSARSLMVQVASATPTGRARGPGGSPARADSLRRQILRHQRRDPVAEADAVVGAAVLGVDLAGV